MSNQGYQELNLQDLELVKKGIKSKLILKNFEGKKYVLNENLVVDEEVNELILDSCILTSIEIEDLYPFDYLTFYNCKIEEITTALSHNIKVSIEIYGSQTSIKKVNLHLGYDSDITISNGKIKEVFIFNPLRKLCIDGGKIDSLSLVESQMSIHAFPNGGNRLRSNIEICGDIEKKPEVQKLTIFGTFIDQLLIEDLILEKCYLSLNLSKDSVLKLSNSVVENFSLADFYNEGTAIIEGLRSEGSNSKLYISDSNLGNTYFRNCKLNGYNHFETDCSNFAGIELYNTEFPIWTEEGDFKTLYEFYNDLYTAVNKRNNTKDQIKYYRATQNYLLKTLQGETRTRENKADIRALSISKWFSNFGTDWLKVVERIFYTGVITYCVLLTTLDNSVLDLSMDVILDTLSRFFLFLIPIRGIDFIDGIGNYSWASTIIDFVFRIFMAIAIFELIRSFRKYMRR